MKFLWTSLFLAQLAVLAFGGPQVLTDNGVVEGIVDPEHPTVHAYRGIPFAETTAGPNRWQRPKPIASWSGVYDATNYGDICPQSSDLSTKLARSENCLNLNVWAPAKWTTLQPVLVWIHGGGFIFGAGSGRAFTGGKLVNSSDIVVVTINYRMGALGFLAAKAPDGSVLYEGNYGFRDQQLALQWVQRNIAAFGGDPKQVTLAGQSAGAMSVQFHMVAPSSKGLFAQAMLMSPGANLHYRTLEQNYRHAEVFANDLFCKGLADTTCLRNAAWEWINSVELIPQIVMTWQEPLRTLTAFPWAPTVDGDLIPLSPMDAANAGRVANIPTLWGSTRNESFGFIPSSITVDLKFYEVLLNLTFQPNISQVLSHYPLSSPTASAYAALTDMLFNCPVRFGANAMSKINPKTWLYLFSHAPTNDPLNGKLGCSREQAACHSADIPFVFLSQSYTGRVWTRAEQRLAGLMSAHVVNFVRGRFQTLWTPYSAPSGTSYQYDSYNPREISAYRADFCNFWDSLGYPF